MKPFIYLLLAVGSTAVSSGCSKDALDTVPDDRISTEIFWKTDADAESAANSVYPYLDGTNIFRWEGMTDTGHTNQVFNSDANIERGIHDALNSRFQTEWTNAYKGIQAANAFLANVGKVQATDPAKITRLTAEVQVLRAYQYIKLVGLFGEVPLIQKPLSTEVGRSVTRTPTSEIWDFVASELTAAAAILPVTQPEKGRVTKGAALALKARAMLWAGRYQDAADAAKQVMDLNVYTLYPRFSQLFSYAAENNAEVVLDKEFIKDSYSHDVFNLLAPYSQQSSNSQYVPTKALVDGYSMQNGKDITDPTSGFDPRNPYKNRDPRLRGGVFVPGDTLPNNTIYNPLPGSNTADLIGGTFIATSTGFNLKKYINKEDLTSSSNSGINVILLRYAEVLLTYAEAKIELGQVDASALAAINKVRQRPDVKLPALTDALTQAQAREVVRRERTLELAFEGLRLFDIRRWKIGEAVMRGPVYGATYVQNGVLATVMVSNFDRQFDPAKHYLWPIPQKERELDSQLTQNPNW